MSMYAARNQVSARYVEPQSAVFALVDQQFCTSLAELYNLGLGLLITNQPGDNQP